LRKLAGFAGIAPESGREAGAGFNFTPGGRLPPVRNRSRTRPLAGPARQPTTVWFIYKF